MSVQNLTRILTLTFVVGCIACAPDASPDATSDADVEARPGIAAASETDRVAEPASTPGTVTITVDVSEFRSSAGMAQLTLYDKEDEFLSEDSKTARVKRVEIESEKATCTFEGVAPGAYAIALMHDEDGDGEMKKNLIGIPKEGIGMSNNAKPKFGPPKWKDAVFTVDAEDVTLAISMMYM